MYLVFELMHCDLKRVIGSLTLGEEQVRFMMFQVLHALHYLHLSNIIHRDLKPENIFLNKDCSLKLGDFNLARKIDSDEEDYVVTRWYRAPEVLLTTVYSSAIDIWSAGCILAEMFGRTVLFRGDNPIDQIERIIALMGTPTKEDLPYYRELQTSFISKLPLRQKTSLESIFPKASAEALDLLSKMLVYNPDSRYTALQCLNHSYFAKLRAKHQLAKNTPSLDLEFEKEQLTPDRLRDLLFDEAIAWHSRSKPSSFTEPPVQPAQSPAPKET